MLMRPEYHKAEARKCKAEAKKKSCEAEANIWGRGQSLQCIYRYILQLKIDFL